MKHFFFLKSSLYRNFHLYCISLLFALTCVSHTHAQQQSALLPLPNHISERKGKAFSVKEGTTAIYVNDESLNFAAEQLAAIIKKEMGLSLAMSVEQKEEGRLDKQTRKSINKQSPKGARALAGIQLLIVNKANDILADNSKVPTTSNQSNAFATSSQRYTLEVNTRQLIIKGASPQAVFYGIQTLHQLLIGNPCATAKKEISPIYIEDEPRFAYRALMLDPARHFLPVDDVKFYIDQMARYKYNVLQLHLTDDQGWRVEIMSRPELASKEHYTQNELKDLIAYAAQRHIEIVPEIDIPGHTVAILAAYPELGCTTADTIAKKVGETVNLMLCASVDKVYDVYQDIFREMAEIFPSKHIHLGGDESVIEKNWARCKRCQQQMKDRGYTKASQLMIPFFDKMLAMVKQVGKSPVLWCELDNIYPPANEYLFPYPTHVTLVTWRNGLTPKCIELTRKHGNPLIMAPGEYTYFDYPQLKGDLPEFNNWGMPITTLEQAYSFDPSYGLTQAEQAHIQGVMGTLWGEAMPDINRVTYMTYPRALALAEAGWTQMEHRTWDSFKQRMYPNLYTLMKAGVSIRVPFEIIKR